MFPIPDQIDDLEDWVSKNKNKYFRNVDTSICSKWKEYHYYNKVPLPCCCKRGGSSALNRHCGARNTTARPASMVTGTNAVCFIGNSFMPE